MQVHLSSQALKEVVDHAGRVARHEHIPSASRRLQHSLAKLSNHGVWVHCGRLGEGGQDQAVHVLKGRLVQRSGVSRQCRRTTDVGNGFVAGLDDPVR